MPLRGAVITVSGTGDGVAADGACSLREAIQAANTDTDVNECVRVGAADPDEIHFAIAGGGPHVIQPTDVLPPLFAPVVLDGSTQPGSVCPGVPVVVGEGELVPSPGDLRIVVNGALAGPADGLALVTGDSTVRGLVINGFADGYGIRVEGSNNRIECNFIGTDATGSTSDANLDGVGIVPTEGTVTANVVGVSGGVGFRNVISGNTDSGVVISFTDANMVAGNFIGTSADGTGAVANAVGVDLDFADENVVGTDGDSIGDAGERNVISGNTFAGVRVEGAGNVVAGNFIGTNAAGNCHFLDGCAVGNGIGVVLGDVLFDGQPQLRTAPPGAIVGRQMAADEALIKENLIAGNATGILVTTGEVDIPFAAGSNDNCVVANGDGVVNDLQIQVVFEDNWWGAADGPSPPGGTGSGDSVVGSVDFDPFLTAPAAVCSGTVTIVKDTVPDDPQDFAFTRQRVGSATSFGFVLDDDGGADATNPASRSFVLEAGIYEVTEADPTGFGFALTALDCADSTVGGLGSTGDLGSRAATVRLEPGETVACTFTDSRFASIDLEKATNGVDADAPPGPSVPVGSPLAWAYVVTNTSGVPLSAIAVTDDQGVAVSCPKTTLAVGEAMTCTGAGTAVAGLYRNVGTAAGKTPDGRDAVGSDPSHYLGVVEGAAIDVEKSTNGADADLPPGPFIGVGDPVVWTYLVANAGTAALADVTVVDDHGLTIFCGGATPPPEGDPPVTGQPFSLAVGEVVSCSAFGTAVAGQYANVATATGMPDGGPPVEDSDPSHYFGAEPENPAIDLEKATNGADADLAPGPTVPVGAPVAWTYRVTNTGDVGLTGVAVTDDQGVVVSCPQTTLAVGETFVCTGAGTAAAGLYENLGSVTATSPGGQVVGDTDPSHYFGAACFAGPTATGAGDATLCFLGEAPGCGLVDVAFIPLEGDVQSPPAGSAPPGVAFPFGLFTFGVGPECSPGFTATFTLTLPAAPPAGTQYWKYGPTTAQPTPHWYVLPASIAANVVTFSITDGGLGDHDLVADGTIVDPSGPGAAQVSVVEIPTLGAGPLVLLGLLLALAAVAVLRRRRTS